MIQNGELKCQADYINITDKLGTIHMLSLYVNLLEMPFLKAVLTTTVRRGHLAPL